MDFVCVTAAPAPLLRRPLGAEVPAGSGGARAALSRCGQSVIIDVAWIRVHYTV